MPVVANNFNETLKVAIVKEPFHIHIVSSDTKFISTLLKEYSKLECRVSKNSFLKDTLSLLQKISPNIIIIDYSHKDAKSDYTDFYLNYTYKDVEKRAFVILAIELISIEVLKKFYNYGYDDYFLKPLLEIDYIGKIKTKIKEHNNVQNHYHEPRHIKLQDISIQDKFILQEKELDLKIVEVIHRLLKNTFLNVLERPGAELMFERILNKRDKKEFELLYIDIDNFDYISLQFGKAMANKILSYMSDLLLKNKKGDEIIARWEINRFVIFCADMSQSSNIEVARIIQNKVSKSKIVKNFTLSCSTLCCTISKKNGKEHIFAQMQTNMEKIKAFHKRQPVCIGI